MKQRRLVMIQELLLCNRVRLNQVIVLLMKSPVLIQLNSGLCRLFKFNRWALILFYFLKFVSRLGYRNLHFPIFLFSYFLFPIFYLLRVLRCLLFLLLFRLRCLWLRFSLLPWWWTVLVFRRRLMVLFILLLGVVRWGTGLIRLIVLSSPVLLLMRLLFPRLILSRKIPRGERRGETFCRPMGQRRRTVMLIRIRLIW